MRNDKVLVPSFKKDDSMFHGLDGDRASPEPFQVLPRWLLASTFGLKWHNGCGPHL